jgi:hypothetical protein
MKFTGTFRTPRINLAAYRQRLHEVLGDAIAHAAFEWLSATVQEVPVWSGASRATFMPLASLIGFQVSFDAIKRRGGINLGLSHATGDIKTDGGVFTFTYATSLEHLIYNEFNNGNIVRGPGQFGELIHPGPYHFQQKGLEAFHRFAADVRLPEVPFTVKTFKVS